MNLPAIRHAKEDRTPMSKLKKAALITGVSAVALGSMGYVGVVYDQSSLQRENVPIAIEAVDDEIFMDYHTDSRTIGAYITGISSFARATVNDVDAPIRQRSSHEGRIEHTIRSVPEGDSRVTIVVTDGKRHTKKIITLKRQTKDDYKKQVLERQLARTEEALQGAESNMNDDTIASARAELQQLPEEKRTPFSERLTKLEEHQRKEKEQAEKERRAAEAQKEREEAVAAALRAQRSTSPQQHTPQPKQYHAPQPPRYNTQQPPTSSPHTAQPPRRTSPSPTPQPPAPSNLHFKNCKEARAAGYSHIRRGQPGYARHLDRDGDGIACDKHR